MDSYLREKMLEAQHVLACHPDSIKRGLEKAFLRFAPLATDDVPKRYRSAYGEIKDALLAKGNVQTTLNSMDDSDASKIAEKIVDLLHELQRDRPSTSAPSRR